jgi:6-phosphogluconolactonase
MSLRTIDTASAIDFTQKSAETIASMINACIDVRGACIVGLSGGSTPQPIYTQLGQADINWSKVSIFLVDERYVPADHADSNQKMVKETLLAHASIPQLQICFPDTSLAIGTCMQLYTIDLQRQWADHLPDLMILGMGPDGHIASLFPPVADDLMDDSRLIAHTTTDEFAVHDRITLTLNPIAAASAHVFLLKGEDKKRVWEEMMTSEEDVHRWPAKRIVEQGEVTVIHG